MVKGDKLGNSDTWITSTLNLSGSAVISGNKQGLFIGDGGIVTMTNGTINGNITDDWIVGSSYSGDGKIYWGGGVYLLGYEGNSSFSMSGGTINGNHGSGVYLDYSGAFFTMSGGTISGNDKGGVDSSSMGTFVKSGGTIDATNLGNIVYAGGKIRKTAAGPGVNMDSRVAGSLGGWE